MASNLTDWLVKSGEKPYLPRDAWLNVNFPAVGEEGCSRAEDVRFVLSRIFEAVPFVSGEDVETCGRRRLPTESEVVRADGCFASVSVGMARDKLDANASVQAVVLEKLEGLLSCLP